MILEEESKRISEFWRTLSMSVYVIMVAKYVREALEMGRSPVENVNKFANLANIPGLKIPRKPNKTEEVFISRYCGPALIELGVQIQNILRYHIDARRVYPKLKNDFNIPKGWSEETVRAIYSTLERNAQLYNLDGNNMPTYPYRCESNIGYSEFKAEAILSHVKFTAFFPNFDALNKTQFTDSILEYFKLPDFKGLLGGTVPCVPTENELEMILQLAKTNILVCFSEKMWRTLFV